MFDFGGTMEVVCEVYERADNNNLERIELYREILPQKYGIGYLLAVNYKAIKLIVIRYFTNMALDTMELM